ncbi:MAG TPA: hypothetical protein VNT75_16900, partial [Symbiobacteriaceae bacterium]|nr:hypothetical protein [Symbiobacteriaceae bacterium]
PFSVLNARECSASTRVTWIASFVTDPRLHGRTGLHRTTVAGTRARLADASLAVCYTEACPGCAAMPGELLTGGALTAGARLLYGQLQGVPGFSRGSGTFTFASLATLTGCSPEALRRAAAELVAARWLNVTQEHRKRPLQFTLQNPISTLVRARVSSIRRRVKATNPRGEALLREFLNAMLTTEDYEDNASPDMLLNPFTRELMELDRYYPTANVGVEFNGAQHYQETELASFDETVKQVGRDAMKAFICKARGIELVVIHPEDLSWKAIDKKLPRRLPRRSAEGLEPLVTELEALASDYRRRTAEEQERKKVPGR